MRAINDGFDEIDADETRAMRNSITVGNLIESDLVAVDDASAGIYFPIPVTSCKVKRSDGGKVFVNICMHSTLEPDENVLNKHTATEVCS